MFESTKVNAAKDGLATFNVSEGTEAEILVAEVATPATKHDLNLVNAKFANSGKLTISASTVNVMQNLDTSADAGKYVIDADLVVADGNAYSVKNLFVGAEGTVPFTATSLTDPQKELNKAYNEAKTFAQGNVTVGTADATVKTSGINAETLTLNNSSATVTLNAKSESTFGIINAYDGTLDAVTTTTPSGTTSVTSAAKATIGTINAFGGSLTLGGEFNIETINADKATNPVTPAPTLTVELSGKNTIGTINVADGTTGTEIYSSGTTKVSKLVIGSATAATAASSSGAGFEITGGTFTADQVTVGSGYATDVLTVTAVADTTLKLGTVEVAKSATFDIQQATSAGVPPATPVVKATIDSINVATGATKVALANTVEIGNLTIATGNVGKVTMDDTVSIDSLKIGASSDFSVNTNGVLELGSISVEGSGSTLGKLKLANGTTLKTDYTNVLSTPIATTPLKKQEYIDPTGTVTYDLYGEMEYNIAQYGNLAATGVLGTGAKVHLKEGYLVSATAGQLADLSDVASIADFDAARSAVQVKASGAVTTIDTSSIVATPTVGSMTFIGASSTAKLANVTVADATLRGDAQGNLVLFGENIADNHTVTFKSVSLGEIQSDRGVYNGTVNVDTGITVNGGSFTLGDVQGSGSLTLAKGSLTLIGATNSIDKADSSEGKYSPLTIGYKPAIAATSSTAAVPASVYGGAITVNPGQFLALGNYEAQAKAQLAAAQAKILAANPTSTVKANLVYIGQQTALYSSAPFAVRNVYVDLANVAATEGYDKTQSIYKGQAITGTTITLDGLNKDVVVSAQKDRDTVANYIYVGDLLGNVELGNVFYQNGTITAADNGRFEVKFDEEEIYDMNEAGFNSAALVEDGIRTFTAPTNPIAATIYNNWGDWSVQCEKAVAEALVASGLLEDGKTVEDILAANETTVEGWVKAGNERAYWKLVDQVEEQFANQIVNEENTATNLAVAGGAFNAALDVNDQVTAAIDRRTSLANLNAPRTEGFTPWVDVFGTANENEAYEADIYGAVLGFDYTASCGGVFGAAFNVGTADSNSANNATKVDNSADFYGFSIYGAQTFGDFNVKADFGYTKLKNELSANTAFFGAVSEKLDSDVLTFGVGAEYLVKFGQLNVVPHAGLRVSRLSMDDSQYGASYDDMTVYQMPMGVAFSGTFETNGWQLAPMVDLTVVPAFGDKNAIATDFGGIEQSTRVVDTNPIQVKLGVEAQNGAFTFGVNYGLLAGGDDRMNNSFNANVRYTF